MSVAIRVALSGDRQMKAVLERVASEKGMRKIARAAALEYGGDVLLPRVQARTPVKTGRLLRSERIRVLVSSKKEDIRVSIVAGGDLAPYAPYVHEQHKTKSKFVQSVIMEARPEAGPALAKRIDEGFKGIVAKRSA